MCGITGIIGRTSGGLYARDLDLMETALVIDTIRGKDSVGCFTAFKNKQAMAIKHGSNPFEMFKTKEWNTFRTDSMNRGRFVIGHNRAATRGNVNTDNAHPFVEEHIILVHNGTIHNQEKVSTTKVEVDSNAIAHALVTSTPEEVFPNINGAFACVWFDTNQQKLFAIRNAERPLNIMVTEQHFLISSEPWIMTCPAMRQDRKIIDLIEIEPGDLYSWDMDGKMSVTQVDLSKKVTRATMPASTGTTTVTEIDEVTGEIVSFFPRGTANRVSAGTSPEEIREALVTRAKQIESQPSTSCALTQRPVAASMTTTVKDLISNSFGPNESSNLILSGRTENSRTTKWSGPTGICNPQSCDREYLACAKNKAETPMYPIGRKIIFRINTTETINGRTRVVGKCLEPGMEMVDVTGYLPLNTVISPAQQATGFIFFTTISVHGPACHVTDVERCVFVTTNAKQEIPLHMWNIAFGECVCNECHQHLHQHERPFTSVTTKAKFNLTKSGTPLNTIQVICPDCLEKKIPEGEYLDKFRAQRRNLSSVQEKTYVVKPTEIGGDSSVQDRKLISESTRGGLDKQFGVPSSETVH